MEAVLVDTDVFSFLWQNRPEGARYGDLVVGRLLALSFTSVAEAQYGALKAGWGERRMAELERALRPYAVLPYNRQMAVLWARVRVDLEARGVSIRSNDLWIAATALNYGLPLITHNRRHFAEVDGLKLLPR